MSQTPPPPPPPPVPPGYWQASDGNWYPPEQHPEARRAGAPPTPPAPTAQPANPIPPDGEMAPHTGPVEGERSGPRLWVLIGGAWMAVCWLGVIGSIASGNPGPALLFVFVMVPVNLLWRFVYWRRRKTPVVNVMKKAPVSGFTVDHLATGLVYGGATLDERGMRQREADFARADARQAAGPNLTGRMLQRGVNRGCGSMIAGFFFPMRDALRELRWANGGKKPPVI